MYIDSVKKFNFENTLEWRKADSVSCTGRLTIPSDKHRQYGACTMKERCFTTASD